MKHKIVWTIAGSDPSSGAGIQTDLKTFQQLGIHGCSIITAITAQNNNQLTHIHYLPPDSINQQIKSLKQDLLPSAIKIGMLGTSETISTITPFLKKFNGFVILDPVLKSSSGKNLFCGNLKNYLCNLKNLISQVDIITPNVSEAEILTGTTLNSHEAIQDSASKILNLGAKHVLIKGGHFKQDEFSQDYWTNGHESCWLSNPRLKSANYRGTGCTLSSAIAAFLTLGHEMKDALVLAKMYINRKIRLADFSSWTEEQIDLPFLSSQPNHNIPLKFIKYDQIGLYPIVDSVMWMEKLLPLGIKTLQLRIKNKNGTSLENEIKAGIQLAKKWGANLFINDYWELALKLNAFGVHLGQQDLNTANIPALRKAGIRLGISTHCYYEVARAHAIQPSYIAIGPIYPTTSKIMPFLPQGIEKLTHWQRILNYPLVAIGGINQTNFLEIISTKVQGIAMISAITEAKDPILAAKKLVTQAKR